jgi:hypothetical protein
VNRPCPQYDAIAEDPTIRRQSRISNALMTTRSTCTPFAKRAPNAACRGA